MKFLNHYLVGLATIATSALASTERQLFNFSTYVDIENSHLRPNGQLLLSTFDNASLFILDPTVPQPEAELVSELPGATALCAITPIGYDKFAVIGGVRGNYSYTNETIYIVDYSQNATQPSISVASNVTNATMLNGMDSLPKHPHIVMAGDARQGAVYRVDTTTGSWEIAIQDEALSPPADAAAPLGINGLKISNGYLYYTNTARNVFGRVSITDEGFQNGDLETIAELTPGVYDYDWDDFIFDASGAVFVAQPPSAIARILPNGTESIFIGGGNDTSIFNPTSLSLAKNGRTAYVTTRGGTLDGYEYSGQVVEVQL